MMRKFVGDAVQGCASLDTLIKQAGSTNIPDDVTHVLVHIHPVLPATKVVATITDADEQVIVTGCKISEHHHK